MSIQAASRRGQYGFPDQVFPERIKTYSFAHVLILFWEVEENLSDLVDDLATQFESLHCCVIRAPIDHLHDAQTEVHWEVKTMVDEVLSSELLIIYYIGHGADRDETTWGA